MINNKTMGHHRERIQGQPIRFEQAASQHEAVGVKHGKKNLVQPIEHIHALDDCMHTLSEAVSAN